MVAEAASQLIVFDGNDSTLVTGDYSNSGSDASGAEFEIVGMKVQEGKSDAYTYTLNTGGSTKSSRYIKLVVVEGYSAELEFDFYSNSSGKTRYAFIDTSANSSTTDTYCSVSSSDYTPIKTTYTLDAGIWYLNCKDSVNFDFISLTINSLGSTIEPLSVTYNHNYTDSVDYVTITDEYGRIANNYTPTRDGYDFNGWYSNKDCTIPFDFSKAVDAPITLYADWIKIINIEAKGSIIGNLDNLKGLTLKLEDAEQGLSHTYTISDSLTYDFGTIKNGNYTLSTNDTTGLISITSSTEIVIENETDVVGDIVIESLDKMNKSYSWDVTQGLVKGYNGNGLIALEDMPYSAEKGYAQGTTNPSIESNTPSSGAAIKFIAGANGTVTVNLTFGSSAKTNYASCDGTVLVSYKGQSEDYDLVFEVEAGKTYFVYGSGTKFMFKGISFVKDSSAILNYQYDNDAAPTAIRFIGTISDVDYTTIESITLSFKLGTNEADVNITKLYTSVANTFEAVDNTYYVCYAITEITAAIGQSFEATLTVTFNNGNEALTQTRSFTLGE